MQDERGDMPPEPSRWRVLPEPVRWADTTTTQPVGGCPPPVGCVGVGDGGGAAPDPGDGE